MKHRNTKKMTYNYIKNYPLTRLKPPRKGFDWGSLDSPKEFATSAFISGLKGGALILATAILTVCVIKLMSEQI